MRYYLGVLVCFCWLIVPRVGSGFSVGFDHRVGSGFSVPGLLDPRVGSGFPVGLRARIGFWQTSCSLSTLNL
jgi:hypothetical protein